MPHPFARRGSNNHVTRKMNTLSNIPLTGKAVSSPTSLTSTYSRNPPLSIATGMKHIQTISDFNSRMISGMRMNCHKISVYQTGFVFFHPIFPEFMRNMSKNEL